jgi:hypothetical protein
VIRSVQGLLGFGADAERLKRRSRRTSPIALMWRSNTSAARSPSWTASSSSGASDSPPSRAWSYTVFDGPRKSRYLLDLTLDVKYNAKGSGKEPECLRGILSAVFEVNQDVKFAVSYRHAWDWQRFRRWHRRYQGYSAAKAGEGAGA